MTEFSFDNPPPNATVGELCRELRKPWKAHDYDQPQYVRGYPGGHRVKPLEIWLPSLSTWLRADGFSYNGDYGRPYVYPGLLQRWRIRRAVDAWSDQTGAFWEGDA